MASLSDVPDEIVHHILFYVSHFDNLDNVQLLSRRFHQIANEPLLWRYHCRTTFHYWHASHSFPQKLRQPVSEVDWKALWLSRMRRNVRISKIFDNLLVSKVRRMTNMEKICMQAYDAKDFLLEQSRTDESADDVLTRRYYANMALDSIHRGIAVDVWSKYQGAPMSSRDLERALGAFDMFVLHDQPQDLEYISTSFDNLAEQFRNEHPNIGETSLRQKALSLVRWLREKNLTGMEDPELNYRNIRNCFIGHALSDPQHPSLPIISSAIFCAVADRLDMKTSCCAFPSHVHASVFAPPGQSLDGTTSEPGTEMEAMYLDPYGSDEEITVEDLRLRLVEFGWASGSDVFLSASPVPVIVQRTAQNIKTTYARAQELRDGDQSGVELKRLRTGHPEMNLEAAFYGSMWAQLLTKQISNIHWNVNLNSFLNRFALTWSEDAWIVEKYLVPLYDTFIESRPQPRNLVGWENVREILAMLRNLDQRQPTISRRYTQDIHNKVHHKIGDVFKHKRYGYVGVINGWAATGTTALPTPHYMTADETEEEEEDDGDNNGNNNGGEGGTPLELPSIRSRTYYTCLRSTVDRLRVAQENIEIVTDPDLIPETLFFMAGKFFKRFDRANCKFVSNIREFYPDD